MFYENFLKLCNSVGKTPSAVVSEIGITKTCVMRWKKGGKPRDATLRRIATYFGVSTEALLGKPSCRVVQKRDISNNMNTFADRLREAMAIAEKTQADLMRETGLNRRTISRYFSGRCEPKRKALCLLAQALDVNEYWLMGRDVKKERSVERTVDDKYGTVAEIVKKLLKMDADTLALTKKIIDALDIKSKKDIEYGGRNEPTFSR